jgi:REP element-mobilizing transposase RayT
LIAPDIEAELYDCIRSRCRDLQAHLHAIGGVADHVHVLIRLPSTLTIAQVVRDIKGASSHFATHVLKCVDFQWQGAYSAFSVGADGLAAVISYISHQKQHHAGRTIRAAWELDMLRPGDPQLGNHPANQEDRAVSYMDEQSGD